MNNRIENRDITFTTTSFVFTRMQVLIWIANGTSVLNVIEKDAGNLLAKLIKEENPDKPLVVSLKGIVNIDDHALDLVYQELNNNNRQLIILDGFNHMELISKLKKESNAIINTSSDSQIISIGRNDEISLTKLNSEKQEAKEKFIKDTVRATFCEFGVEKRLASTPIIANGEFDSNHIISNNKKFIWITFFLSDELQIILDKYQPKNVKLLTASLRAAPFGAMLGLLHNLKVETIDHLGPKQKVFDLGFLDNIEKGTSFIYIGDFCFLGTEIKIAKTYTELKFSNLNFALVIGNLIDKEVFKEDYFLHSLVSLEGLCHNSIFKL